MPPKQGKATNHAHGKKKEDDAEFDQLLKQLAKSTAAKGKEEAAAKKHEPKHMTVAERKAAHREREREKEEALSKTLEQRAQQRALQQMIRDMMARGGGGAGFFSPFLDAPNTKIETETVAAKAPSKLTAGCAAMQGWRRGMEDAHILYPHFRRTAGSDKDDEDWHLFAVMDGHGGEAVAHTTKVLLPAILHKELDKAAGMPSPDVLAKAFSEADAAIKKKHGADAQTCGSTCVAVLVNQSQVVCASVGDSRAVLARKAGTANDVVTLAFDHKPENDEEKKRIYAANGTVENNRVNGNLAMSRALGDFTYKNTLDKHESEQQVVCVPDVHAADRKADDEFVVVACDGIFDVLTNEELVAAVRNEIALIDNKPGARLTGDQLAVVAGNITKKCLAPAAPEGASGPGRAEGSDNMSIIVVQL